MASIPPPDTDSAGESAALVDPTPKLAAREVSRRLDALASPCVLCEERCGALRSEGEQGSCGLADQVFVYNRLIHLGEETPLSPSYAIFLAGCSLRCSHCSEWRHRRPPFEVLPITAVELADRVSRDLRGAPGRSKPKNVNFVGGEPMVSLPFIARFVVAGEEQGVSWPPLLLNTNGYVSPEVLALSTHLAEIFVVDLKLGNNECASRVAGVEDYFEMTTRSLAALHDQVGCSDDEQTGNVSMQPVTLWVRHLLMPGHLDCCTRPCLEWLSERLPNAFINVMPAFVSQFSEPGSGWGSLTRGERARGLELLRGSTIRRAYFDGRRLRP